MKNFPLHKPSIRTQFIISILLVLAVSIICFFTESFIGYRVVALLLLMTVSVIAMLFDIIPVLLSAVLSAAIWNFFFITPLYTFHITGAEDLLMFMLYFIVALVNAVLTYKIRQAEKKVREKQESEKTIKLYNTLLNSLSHELRTPIATIIGAIDSLKYEKGNLSVENQHQLLTEIDIASVRLNRQVENLLNMSRLESGMLAPKNDWCDLNELVNATIQKLEQNENHIIQYHSLNELPLFKLDAGLLEQILYNILHNAIQYTPNGTQIEVMVKHDQNNCVITIKDNGPGFPNAEMEQVFTKFYRLPHSKTGGSGLGLSIVKGFTEAMGGSVSLENNQPTGAFFTVTIPAETSYINNLKHE